MDLEVTREPYEMACSFTAKHWPAHNREQGIEWNMLSFGLLATKDGSPVGAATVKIVGGSAYLEQLVVEHGRTRTGIGSTLIHEFEKLAREHGCHVLELETAESQARPFYERHGFRVVAEKPNSKFGQTWFFMQKQP